MGPSARVTPRPARWLIHRLPSVGSGWAPGHGPVRDDRATSIAGAQRLRPLLAEGGSGAYRLRRADRIQVDEVLLRQPELGVQLLPEALPVCERKLRNSSNLLEAAIATRQ
jgi:hypothetical protein